jgi:tRNA(Ile2) C34 agmatinyltransferase TiaS
LATDGNGTLAKVAAIRERHLAEFKTQVAQFRLNVQQLREKYLNELVELTMMDPNIAAVQKALDFFRPTKEIVEVVSAPVADTEVAAPTEVDPAVAATLATPEKQVMKVARKVSRRDYGKCPSCNAPTWIPGANFCSACAYPFEA